MKKFLIEAINSDLKKTIAFLFERECNPVRKSGEKMLTINSIKLKTTEGMNVN